MVSSQGGECRSEASLRQHAAIVPHRAWIRKCDMKNQLELVNLEKRYGDTIAVRGFDLSLPENTSLLPFGTIRDVARLPHYAHDCWSCRHHQWRRYSGPPKYIGQIAAERSTSMMFQSYALFPHLKHHRQCSFCFENRRSQQS